MSDNNGMHAVSVEHLFWKEADNENEAIEKAIKEISNMSEKELKEIDFSVVDYVENEEW